MRSIRNMVLEVPEDEKGQRKERALNLGYFLLSDHCVFKASSVKSDSTTLY